jgi:hypothetical protein
MATSTKISKMMKMKDYLQSTGDAVAPIFNAVEDSYGRLFKLDIDIHHWVHLENYLHGREHNGWGPKNFSDWRRDMGEDPTVESVLYWRGQLEAMRDARREAINTLCASILMIAQTGIKLVLGAPKAWKQYEDTVMSSQNECILKAIWHGRNLAAHVEGLSVGTPSHKYFEGLVNRRGVDLLAPATQSPCTYVVREILGWIDTRRLPIKDVVHKSYESPYIQDMTRIGALA